MAEGSRARDSVEALPEEGRTVGSAPTFSRRRLYCPL